MGDTWIDKLIRAREAKTQQEQQNQELEGTKKGDAPHAAFVRFCSELEDAVRLFNEKYPDPNFGRLRSELRGDSTIAIVREIGNSDHKGQVTISLDLHGPSLVILHQPGGMEMGDKIELRPHTDEQVYFWRQDTQISAAHAAQHVLSTFVMAI